MDSANQNLYHHTQQGYPHQQEQPPARHYQQPSPFDGQEEQPPPFVPSSQMNPLYAPASTNINTNTNPPPPPPQNQQEKKRFDVENAGSVALPSLPSALPTYPSQQQHYDTTIPPPPPPPVYSMIPPPPPSLRVKAPPRTGSGIPIAPSLLRSTSNMSAQSGSGSTKATTGMTLSGNSPKVPWLPPVPPPVEQYDGGSSGMKNTTTNNKNSHNIGDSTATRIQLPEPGIAGMPYAPIRRQISNISQNSGGILSPKNMDGEYQEGSGNPSLNNNSNMGMMMMMMPPLPPPPPAWQQQQQQQQQQHPEELLSARYQEEHHHQQQPTDAVVAPELEQTWDAGVEALEGGGGEEGQIYASNNGDQPYYQQQQEYYRQDTYAYQYGQQQQGEGGGMKADGGGGDTDMPSLPHGPSCTGDVPSYDNDTANTANLKLPPPPGAENSPIKAKFARSLRKGMLISAHSGVLPRVTTDDNNNSAPTDENHHHHHQQQQQQHVGDENENANSARHHQQDEYAYRDDNNNNISMDDEHQHQQHQQQPGSSDFGAPPTLPPVTTLLKQECPPLGGQPGSGQGGRPVGPFMRPNSSRSNGDGGGDGGNRNAVTSPTFMPLATVGGSDSARSGQQQQAPPSFLQRPGSGGALDGNGSSSGSLHPPLPSQPPSASSQQQQQQPYKFQQQQPLTTTNNQLQRIKQLKKTKKRSFIRRLLPWLLLLMVVSAIIGAAGVVVCITAVANVIDSMGSVATKVRWNHIPGEVGALIIAINYNNNNNNNGIIITDPPPPPQQQQQQQPQLVWPYPAEESVLIGLHSPAQQLGKVLSVQNEVAQQRAAAILSCSASSNGLPGLGDDGDYDDDLAGMGRDDYGDQEMKEMMASRRKRRQAAALLKKKESAGGRSSVCLWAQWSIKQTLLSVQLSKQAASMALYHGPSVIVTYSKSAAAFLGRHYLELQRQMFGLKSSHGRAEVYAHITGRLGEARQLIKDLMHWSHCLAQHFKVSGMGSWDAIAQPAAGCWQEHLGRYYITGSTNNTGDDVTRSSNNTGDGVVAGQAEGDVEQGEDIAPAYVVGSHVDTGGEHVVDEQPQVVEMDEQKEEIQPLQEQQQQQENSGEEAVEKPPAEVEDNTQPPIDDVLQQEKEIAVADGTDVVEESIQEKAIDIAVAVGTDVVEESIEGDAGEEQQQWEEKAHTPVEGRTQLDPHPVAPAPAPEPHSHASTDSHVGSEVKDVDAYYAEMVAQYEEEQKQQQQQQQQGEGQQQQQHQEEVEEVGKEEDKGEMVVTDIPASPAPVEVVVQLQNGDSLRESLGLTAPVPKPPVDDGSPPERRRKLGDPLTVVEPPSSPQQQHEQHAPPFAPTVEVPPLSPSVVEKTEAAITNAVATISGPLGALAMLVRDKSTEGLVGVKKSGLHAAELLSDVAAQAASSAKTAAGAVGSFLSGSLGSAVVGAALSAGGFMLKSWVDRRANGGVSVVGSPSVVLKAAMGRAKKAVTGNGGGSGSRTKRGDANKKDEAVGDVSDGDGEDEEVRVVAKKTTATARRRKTSAADAIPVSPAKTPSRGRKSKSNVDVQDDNGGARPRSVSRRRRSTLSLRSS